MPVPHRLGAGAIRLAKDVVDIKAAKVVAAKKVIDAVTDTID